jgi:hypothetical protein
VEPPAANEASKTAGGVAASGTGWKPVAIARLLAPESRAAMGRQWDLVIYRKCLLLVEKRYQELAATGALSLPQIGELFRVASEHRPVLLKLIQGGAKLQAVHDKATELARLTKKAAQTIDREVLVRGQRETRH